MKKPRFLKFRKITRVFYLLGVVFLLAGMFLSVASVPAQAGSITDGAAQATRLPPGNPVKPPSVQPPSPKPPVVEPISPPDNNPSTAPQGPGAQNLNRGPASMATPILRSGPSIQATMAPGASVQFTQADYCYDGPAGEISATVMINLPENVPQARLSTDWYIVWPRTGAIEHHYFTPDEAFEDGDTYTFEAQWPGIDQWVEGNTVEIHFGAQLIDMDLSGPISEGDGLDVFYNGGCGGVRPPLQLSYECQDDGSVLWTLHNPNAVPVGYSYTINGQPGGGGVLELDGSITFTSDGGATVVATFDDGRGGTNTLTVTAEECGVPELDPLTLDHGCTATGVTWTVTNPNDQAVNFTWSLDDGDETGSLSVPANRSMSVVTSEDTESAHSLTVTWTGGSATEESVANECSLDEALLEVLYACIDGTETIQWQVRNNGTAATNFTWSLDGGTANASFVGAGDTINVTTSGSGVHTLAVTWSTGTASATSAEGFCTNDEPPVITLDHECADEQGYIDWFATNDSDEDVEVEWSFDDGAQTGTVTIEAGETVQIHTSVGGEHTMQVTYDGEIVVTEESAANECGVPVIQPLNVDYACILGENTLRWSVTNDNDFPVTFNWALDSGAWSTDLVVAANTSLTGFTTSTSTTAHTMHVRWYNAVGAVDGQVDKASPADACTVVTPPPPPSLNLEYACIGTTTNVQWTAVNDGEDSVAFTWTKDAGQVDEESGSDSAPANGERDFLVTNNDAHTVTITWSTETGSLSVTRTSATGICDETTETVTVTPVTITPGTSTVTTTPGTSTSTTSPGTSTTSPGTATTSPGTATSETGTTTTPTPEDPSILGGFQGTSTPGATSTPIATVGVPITGQGESAAVSPATGGDLSRTSGMALWQQILFNGGLLFLGIALIFEGLGRKFH